MRQGHTRARVAVVSLHTSPLDQPGTGDSGGMNVYIRSVARELGRRGVEVDVFTRCAGRGVPEVQPLGPRSRVIQMQAGPCAPVPKADLPRHVRRFGEALSERIGGGYDLVHAHYWLSGWAGWTAAARWGIRLVASFHTLGKVKNRFLAPGDVPEPIVRLSGERDVIRTADRVLVPTAEEASHLVGLYGAAPDRIRVISPGVDRAVFSPRSRATARAALGLEGKRVALFAGRFQPHKAPEVAIRAVAEARRRAPGVAGDLVLAMVGGPSGGSASVERLREVADRAGVSDGVRFFAPVPHERLAEMYAAADLVLVPSRSESFGLVALEAQACGVPVIASDVGGLRVAVAHGRSGLLVRGHDPAAYAEEMLRVLGDSALADRLSRGARSHAAGFSWGRTADRVLSAYAELLPWVGLEGEMVAAPGRC